MKTGEAARSPMRSHDESLSSAATAWLSKLPPRLRPAELSRAFPRVTNRIALCWDDYDLVDSVFNDLLLDRRGGRQGFPPQVAAELLRLHAFHERRAMAPVVPKRWGSSA